MYWLVGIRRSASAFMFRWLALLGLADSVLRQKRRNAKWATLKVDETAAFLDVPKQQVCTSKWRPSSRKGSVDGGG